MTPEVMLACTSYFNQIQTQKNQDTTDVVEYGYHAYEAKEAFVIRNQKPPPSLESSLPYIQQLQSIARHCLDYITNEIGIGKDILPAINGSSPTECHQPKKSDSLLRILYYHKTQTSGEKCFACNSHQDLGLLTILPKSSLPALEIFDYRQDEWIDVESDMTNNQYIIMVGETLSHISNGYYLPATHRVKQTSGERLSLVYQVRAGAEAILDSSQFESTVTGKFHNPFKLTGSEFYETEKQQRSSVNNSY